MSEYLRMEHLGNKNFFTNISHRNLLWLAGVSSLALTWLAYQLSPVLNNDGILYVLAAQAAITDGWSGANQIYPWPLFSWLSGKLSGVTGLTAETSAKLINSAMMAWLAVMFVQLAHTLSRERLACWCALIIILTLPALNDYRDHVARGPSGWAMMFTTVYFLVLYLQRRQARYLSLALLFSLIAALFRIELFLLTLVTLLTPLLMQQPWKQRLIKIAGGIALLVMVSLLVSHTEWLANSRLGMFWNELSGGYQQLSNKFQNSAHALGDAIFHNHSRKFVVDALAGAYITSIFAQLFKLLTPVWLLVLLIHKWKDPNLLERPVRLLLLLLVSLLLTSVFFHLVDTQVLTGRYLVSAMLVLLIPTPLICAYWIKRHRSYWRRMAVGASLVLLAFTIKNVDYLVDTKGRAIITAGHWWQEEQTLLPGNVWFNSMQTSYYSGQVDLTYLTQGIWHDWENWLTPEQAARFDWLVLEMKNDRIDYWSERLNTPPRKLFKGEKISVAVYQLGGSQPASGQLND